jgi:hypothetical protein
MGGYEAGIEHAKAASAYTESQARHASSRRRALMREEWLGACRRVLLSRDDGG